MKKVSFWRIFWASALGSLLVGFIITIIAAVTFSAILGGFAADFFGGPKPLKVKENTVLHIDLNDAIGERTFAKFDATTFSLVKKAGIIEMIKGLEIAAEDDKVKGLFIEADGVNAGFATTKELRDAIEKFKSSGKFVVAYSETMSSKSYYLSSIADEVYCFPTGMLDWRGLGTELMFFTGMFEKLDLEMQIIRGSNNKFKSAVEPFMLSQMSDANREQTTKFLTALWDEMKSSVHTSRKIEMAHLDSIASKVLIRKPTDAIEHKMIDAVMYKDEIIELLKKKSGTAKDKDLELLDFTRYANKKTDNKEKLNKDKTKNIAVIIAQGDIVSGNEGEGVISSERISKAIRDARLDKDIKAVVLRVNSPGGSALASDVIWREVMLTKKEKPVVVSMGDLAASGGYYISCAADKIFAQPNTITGSIGVFGVIPFTGKMLENKVGLTFDRVTTNEHAVLSTNKKLTDYEYQIIQEGVDDIYDDFITKVAEGRKISKPMVDSIGQGRVWAGSDAIKIGLVDELGGFNDALYAAAEMANIEREDIHFKMLPELKNEKLFEFLESMEEIDEMENNEDEKSLVKIFKSYEKHLRSLDRMNGIQARLPYFIRFID